MAAESASAPVRAPAPQPFPADVKAKEMEADTVARQNERKDDADVSRKAALAESRGAAGASMAAPPTVAQAAPPRTQTAAAPSPPAAALSPVAPAPPAAMAAPASPSAPAPAAVDKLEERMRENNVARDEAGTFSAPAAASPALARREASPAELQKRARDPDAWIASIRALRVSGHVAEAMAQMREFRRHVPDAETRLPADLREWNPRPSTAP